LKLEKFYLKFCEKIYWLDILLIVDALASVNKVDNKVRAVFLDNYRHESTKFGSNLLTSSPTTDKKQMLTPRLL